MRQQLIESAARFGYEVFLRMLEIIAIGGQPSPDPPEKLAAADVDDHAEPASNGKTRRLATR